MFYCLSKALPICKQHLTPSYGLYQYDITKSTITKYHKYWLYDIPTSYDLSQVLQICQQHITPPPKDSTSQTKLNPT